MMAVLEALGVALLGGIAAVVTGVSLELIRVLFNRERREEIRGRTWRENLHHAIF